jgi:hypothetical protein
MGGGGVGFVKQGLGMSHQCFNAAKMVSNDNQERGSIKIQRALMRTVTYIYGKS